MVAYTSTDTGEPDSSDQHEQGTYHVSMKAPGRTRRCQNPAPRVPHAYNYVVSTEPNIQREAHQVNQEVAPVSEKPLTFPKTKPTPEEAELEQPDLALREDKDE